MDKEILSLIDDEQPEKKSLTIQIDGKEYTVEVETVSEAVEKFNSTFKTNNLPFEAMNG